VHLRPDPLTALSPSSDLTITTPRIRRPCGISSRSSGALLTVPPPRRPARRRGTVPVGGGTWETTGTTAPAAPHLRGLPLAGPGGEPPAHRLPGLGQDKFRLLEETGGLRAEDMVRRLRHRL